jgi:hypothetical protein
MTGRTINSLRAWKAIWDLTFSEKPEHQRQRDELRHEWECMKRQTRGGLREFEDVRSGSKMLPPGVPVIRKPFKVALWILLAVIFVATLFGGYRGF